MPNFKVGRFSHGAGGEDEIIRRNWEKLVKELHIKNPSKCIEDMTELDKGGVTHHLSSIKRNIIGCYLAQNLPNVRHGADVFQRAVAILNRWNEGKYTQEEDDLILKEVEEHGANEKTFRKLAELMGRRRSNNIYFHYSTLKDGARFKSGRWSMDEFELFFEFVFRSKNTGSQVGIDYINSIPIFAIDQAAKLLGRKRRSVNMRWMAYIKPILLAFHTGTLHTEWKPQFFDYLIKNKIVSLQEINWDDAKEKFPNFCSQSLTRSLIFVQNTRSYKGLPLFLAVKDYQEKTKHSKEHSSAKKLKEDIVFLYNKVMGVSATKN